MKLMVISKLVCFLTSSVLLLEKKFSQQCKHFIICVIAGGVRRYLASSSSWNVRPVHAARQKQRRKQKLWFILDRSETKTILTAPMLGAGSDPILGHQGFFLLQNELQFYTFRLQQYFFYQTFNWRQNCACPIGDYFYTAASFWYGCKVLFDLVN